METGVGLSMEGNKTVLKILTKLGLAVVLCLVILIIVRSNYKNKQANQITLKSRYTFHIRIDEEGKVLEDKNGDDTRADSYKEFNSLKLNEIADIWTDKFLDQFTQKYLSWSKSLRKIKINESEILDRENGTVLISFSAQLKDSNSEYFQSWDGVMDNGVMHCEWVVTFALDNYYDGTAAVYVEDIVSPEEYGIARYNESLKENVSGKTENQASSSGNSLIKYEIRENTLFVTYDGGAKYITVPVDCANLLLEDGSTTQLADGSWFMSMDKTAFVYGGKTIDNNRIPVTLIYSSDKGENWITCEIDTLYDANYYYVQFFDENTGVIVIGYGKNGNQQASRIYETSDGGQTWESVGSGPALNVLKGVIYIDSDIGFFCYDYVDGMDSNLYMTRDGGKTFSKVALEPQELDSTAANAQTTAVDSTQQTDGRTDKAEDSKLTWSDVYKEAIVPVYDEEEILTVYLTQGRNGVYNNGKTVAKYQSVDKGVTWKYIGQLEISS